MTQLIPIDDLQMVAEVLLQSTRVSACDARLTAKALVTTDAMGVFTHGTKLLAGYIKKLQGGGYHATAHTVEGAKQILLDQQENVNTAKKGKNLTNISHDEITRMLAEHGTLGIIGLLILFFTPFVLYLENKFNMFLLCFVLFWLLTINHAAMRIAAPAFVYSLSLLNINLGEISKKRVTDEMPLLTN